VVVAVANPVVVAAHLGVEVVSIKELLWQLFEIKDFMQFVFYP
jgi:hypothetical protein